MRFMKIILGFFLAASLRVHQEILIFLYLTTLIDECRITCLPDPAPCSTDNQTTMIYQTLDLYQVSTTFLSSLIIIIIIIIIIITWGWLIIPACSLVAELWECSSTWLSRRQTRAPLAAAIRLISGHRAQPRSNQGWFLWREENWRTWRKILKAWKRTNKLNSRMMLSPGIKPGTILVRGKCSHHCATRASHFIHSASIQSSLLFSLSFIHLFIHESIHTDFLFIYLFIYPFFFSAIHSIIISFIHSFIPLLFCFFFVFVYFSFVHLILYLFIQSIIHSVLVHAGFRRGTYDAVPAPKSKQEIMVIREKYLISPLLCPGPPNFGV